MYFHPSLGASILINDQLTVQSSSYEAVCSGQEENLAHCPRVDSMVSGERNLCETGSVFVKCFITDEKAELGSDCQPPENDLPTTLPTTTTATASRSAEVTTAAGSSPPLTDTVPSMTSTATQPALPSVTDTSAPTLYYIIGGLSAIIILTGTAFLTMVFLITCCYCRKRKKITEEVKSEDVGQLPLEPLYESISLDGKEQNDDSLTRGEVHQKEFCDCSENPAYAIGEMHHVRCSENPAYKAHLVHMSDKRVQKTSQDAETYYEVIPE